MSRAQSVARYAAWAALGLFLVACFAGPVRAVLGVPIGWATALAVVPACVVVGALAWRVPPPAISGRALLALGAFALLGLLLMWNRRFGPLIGWIGSDGGVHVSYRDRFVAGEPTIYDGFVGLYGFTWIVERLFRTDAFWSFGVAFLIVTVVVCAGAVGAVLRAVTLAGPPASGRRAQLTVGASLAAALIVLVGIALPLVSYYQADGFFTQLWGLLPLLAFWFIEVSPRLDLPRRALLLLLALVLVRYTYGLMLGDLLVVVPGLVVLEAGRSTRRRWHWLLAALLAAAASVLALQRFFVTMADVVTRYGWFIEHDYARVLRGAGLATAALALAALVAPTLGRFLLVPVVIAAANGVASRIVGRHFSGEHYYLYKYQFHALLLLCLAAPAALAFSLGAVPGAAWRRRVLRLCVLAAALGLVEVGRGIQPMRTLFAQRAFNARPTGLDLLHKLRINPLVDLGAVQRIRERLRQEHAQFGGYLISSGPMFNFMNAELGRYAGGFFDYKRTDDRPGHCVFWTRKGSGWLWVEPRWLTREIAVQRIDPRVNCRSYRASWDPRLERDLCSVCY